MDQKVIWKFWLFLIDSTREFLCQKESNDINVWIILMNSKFNLKHKIETKNLTDKNEIKKKEKKTLSKIGSVGALFKKN